MTKFVPKHFAQSLDAFAKEVLSPSIYAKRGVAGLELMDERMLITIDDLRGNLGVPLLVNGGAYTQSGLRDMGYYGTLEEMDKSFSQHKYGRALDFRSSKMNPHDIRKHIIENKVLYPHVSFMEVSPVEDNFMNWVHIDCRTRITDESIRYWSQDVGFVTEGKVIADKL